MAGNPAVNVFVNGQHVPFVNGEGESSEMFKGYGSPGSFDVTDVIRTSEANQIAIVSDRRFLNELGAGGLLAAVVLYAE